jgi:hypothetical protein
VTKLIPIKCELRFSAANRNLFHLVELKTGKEKLVSFGRIYPIGGLKKFIRKFEVEYGVKVENTRSFIREVKADVKARKQK